jgi:hypothetical protein
VDLALGRRQAREVGRPVAKAAAALGVLHLVRVAQHRHAQRRRHAAVVGVAVAEHHRRMPPSFAPALATARVIVRAPASNSVTPPSSSIRYTLQRPGWPCTTHTPVGHQLGLARAEPRQARLGVEGAVIRCSAVEPWRRHHPDLARHASSCR